MENVVLNWKKKSNNIYLCGDSKNNNNKKNLEMPGIEPGAFHMQSERSTTEPHPRCYPFAFAKAYYYICQFTKRIRSFALAGGLHSKYVFK